MQMTAQNNHFLTRSTSLQTVQRTYYYKHPQYVVTYGILKQVPFPLPVRVCH